MQVAGVALSLAAIYLLNMTGEEGLFTAGLAFTLLPVGLWGVTALLQKLSTHHLSGELSTLWFLAAFVPVGLVLLAREPLSGGISIRDLARSLPSWASPSPSATSRSWRRLRGAARHPIITPLTGLYPVVSVPIAVFLLDQPVGAEKAAGIALALVSVVALSWEGRPGRAGSSIQPITSPSRP